MIELWNVPIYWYIPALFAPVVGAWLGGVFDEGGCSACVAGYCQDHES